jgi:hypothetical protein
VQRSPIGCPTMERGRRAACVASAERPHFDGTASSDVLDATACGGGGGGGDGGGGIALSLVQHTLA